MSTGGSFLGSGEGKGVGKLLLSTKECSLKSPFSLLRKLPSVFGAILTRIGVLYPARVSVGKESRWRIFTDNVE